MIPRLPSDQRTGQPTKNLGSSTFWIRLSAWATPWGNSEALRDHSRTLAQRGRKKALIAAQNLQPEEGSETASRAEGELAKAGTGLFPSAEHKADAGCRRPRRIMR